MPLCLATRQVPGSYRGLKNSEASEITQIVNSWPAFNKKNEAQLGHLD